MIQQREILRVSVGVTDEEIVQIVNPFGAIYFKNHLETGFSPRTGRLCHLKLNLPLGMKLRLKTNVRNFLTERYDSRSLT